jgi:hypothetical protein
MGTELGLADFSHVNATSLLPPWVVAGFLLPDDDSSPIVDAPFLFQHALPVAGLLHIFSNASAQIDHALGGWADFHAKCQVLEIVVCNPMRMQLFIAMCLNGGPFQAKANLFRQKVHGLYDKRWGEVHTFCVRLRGIIDIMSQCWRSEKMTTGRDQLDDPHYKALDVGRVLKDPFYRSYLEMIIVINEAMEEMSAWAERCQCHEHLQKTDCRYWTRFPRQALRKEMGEHAESARILSCPLRGCRAPELAAGAVPALVESLFQDALATLTLACRPRLGGEEWARLLADF